MGKRVDPAGVHRDSDGFWSKVLVLTIVVVWISLVAGNWAGKVAIEKGWFSKHKTAAAAPTSEADTRPVFTRPQLKPSAAPTTPAEGEEPAAESPSASPSALASASPGPRATVTVAPPGENASPSPSPAASPSATAAASPAASPSPAPSAEAGASPSPSAAATAWALQMGVFSTEANAEKLAADLKDKGYSVEVVPQSSATQKTFVVRVGHFSSKTDAAEQEAKLKAQGYNPYPVPR